MIKFRSFGYSHACTGLAWGASIDEVVDYLQDRGVPITQDSSGNYYYHGSSGGIMLNEVEIIGYTSNTNSSGSSGHTSTGYSSSGSGSTGYNTGNTFLNAYMSYLTSQGVTFLPDGNGGFTYVAPASNASDVFCDSNTKNVLISKKHNNGIHENNSFYNNPTI